MHSLSKSVTSGRFRGALPVFYKSASMLSCRTPLSIAAGSITSALKRRTPAAPEFKCRAPSRALTTASAPSQSPHAAKPFAPGQPVRLRSPARANGVSVSLMADINAFTRSSMAQRFPPPSISPSAYWPVASRGFWHPVIHDQAESLPDKSGSPGDACMSVCASSACM